MATRLQKRIAEAGLMSRRAAEDLIRSGRVSVNGRIAVLGDTCEDTDRVLLDGKAIPEPEKKRCFMLHKPRGYICAVTDKNYPVILDLLPREYDYYRLFPVGRLDLQSEGLLMLTNDGDFSQEMIHPRAGITKEYEVLLDQPPSAYELALLREGTIYESKKLRPVRVDPLQREPEGRWFSFELNEGVKREIRIIAEAAGRKVQVLFRRKIGRMELRRLKCGYAKEYSAEQLRRMIFYGGIV